MTPELVGQATAFLAAPRRVGPVGVAGDLASDRFVFGSVDRISPEAPVPVLRIERTVDRPGCAANVAQNLVALRPGIDCDLHVVGVVGQDPAGESLLGSFARMGAGVTTHILRDSSRPTTVKTRFIAGSQHQLLRVDEEITDSLSVASAERIVADLEALLPNLKCLVVQDYAKGLFNEQILARVFRAARAHKVLTIVDPNRNTPGAHYRGAGLITPNVSEAEAILGRSLKRGIDDALVADACRELKRMLTLDMALITRSGHGMTLVDAADRIHHFPAIARAVFDVTGAGDTVVAVLAAAFAGGASPEVACALATAASSVVVGKVGTATASVDEIRAALKSA